MDAQGQRIPASGPDGFGREFVPPAQPAGAGEVDHQVQPVDVQVEELAVPGRAGDGQPAERGHRRVVGLQRGEGENIDAGDDMAGRPLPQELRERLHLW